MCSQRSFVPPVSVEPGVFGRFGGAETPAGVSWQNSKRKQPRNSREVGRIHVADRSLPGPMGTRRRSGKWTRRAGELPAIELEMNAPAQIEHLGDGVWITPSTASCPGPVGTMRPRSGPASSRSPTPIRRAPRAPAAQPSRSERSFHPDETIGQRAGPTFRRSRPTSGGVAEHATCVASLRPVSGFCAGTSDRGSLEHAVTPAGVQRGMR